MVHTRDLPAIAKMPWVTAASFRNQYASEDCFVWQVIAEPELWVDEESRAGLLCCTDTQTRATRRKLPRAPGLSRVHLQYFLVCGPAMGSRMYESLINMQDRQTKIGAARRRKCKLRALIEMATSTMPMLSKSASLLIDWPCDGNCNLPTTSTVALWLKNF